MADETAKGKAMGGYLCKVCDFPVQFPGSNKKTLCSHCGTINTKPQGNPSGGWLPCVVPEGFEWREPAGVKGDVPKMHLAGKEYIDYNALVALPLNADVIYIDAFGKEWARADWIKEKSLDPATALKRMRADMVPHPVIHLGS